MTFSEAVLGREKTRREVRNLLHVGSSPKWFFLSFPCISFSESPFPSRECEVARRRRQEIPTGRCRALAPLARSNFLTPPRRSRGELVKGKGDKWCVFFF